MKISVTHVITTIDLGGAEKQLLTLATCQKQKGYDVEIIFLKDNPSLMQNFLANNINVDISFSKLPFRQQVIELRKRQKGFQGIFHAHLPRAELLCALALDPHSFIVTRHNSEPFFTLGPSSISRLLSRFVLNKSFASISISEAVARYLTNSKEMKRNERNRVILYGLANTEVKHREKIWQTTESVTIGTISRLVKQKNLPLLLKTFEIFTKNVKLPTRLVIVGKGPLKGELQSFARKLSIEDSINWLGQTQDVTKIYESIDVFVLTSDYEGFGLVLLEAMSQGVPVIARRVSAIPEVLGANHPGLIESQDSEEFASRILKLITDNSFFQTFLEYQSNQITKFNIENVHAAHEIIYIELLKNREINK